MLEIGDILLEYNGNSEFEKAVLDSGNHHYFHCGLVISETEIIEATPENGVQIQLLSELTQRKFHVFRVSEFKIVSEKLSEQIKRVIGKKYNHYFFVIEYWKIYFKECIEGIPEGLQGTHPSNIILCKEISFKGEYHAN
ncbi:MAG: YiiX/YebB-like N1pC/P60 family cysteine hydrolase [Fusobacteria bacterium]|nr:YiiX/YebB-like N1pC/P60 family cysteine hydrolase [Fusobacteriota bacterium]